MGNPFKSIQWVSSGDGERRARFVWRSKSYAAFVPAHQIRELVRDLILLLQSEETYFASEQPREVRKETASKGEKTSGKEPRRNRATVNRSRRTNQGGK